APKPAQGPVAEPTLRHLRTRESLFPAPSIVAPAVTAPETAVPPPDEALTAENAMVTDVLQAPGPRDALAALTAYRRKFPHGKMEYEADLAEVKAQMALGNDAPALAVLDRAVALRGFDTLPRSPDLSVLRAELLARTGNCKAALDGFSRVLGADA